MTKMVYTVVNRPKKDETGRTDIGWKEDGVSKAVNFAGYLITSRTKRGETRKYSAYLIATPEGFIGKQFHVGDNFETRAQAAFAIWREYYFDVKCERKMAKVAEAADHDQRQKEREDRKKFRATPEGQQAYRDELNRKAQTRRAAMTSEEKAVIAAKRKEKRRLKKLL